VSRGFNETIALPTQKTYSDLGLQWSGRRDSNPRPSPWQREENRPSGPSSALTWCPARRFVRLARPVPPVRIPVYHPDARGCIARHPSSRGPVQFGCDQSLPNRDRSSRSHERLRWERCPRGVDVGEDLLDGARPVDPVDHPLVEGAETTLEGHTPDLRRHKIRRIHSERI
jgi:hypothetical protein